MLERVGSDYPTVKVAKAMCGETMNQAQAFQVRYVPTTVLFEGGKPVDQFVGALPEAELRKRLDALLA